MCAVQTRYAGAIHDPQCDEEVTPAKVPSRSQKNTAQNGDVDFDGDQAMETPCGERRTIDLTESPAHPGEDIRVYDPEIWR